MRRLGLLAASLVAVLASGCYVEVTHVRDPGPAFERARSKAVRLAGRSGPVRELHVLAFDPRDHELVRVDLPMWLVRKADVDWDDIDVDDERGERVKRSLRRHARIEDFDKAGPGILVEVEEDDGEQVLVWLE